MKKNTLNVLILISGILFSGGIISFAYAQTTTSNDIQYPISELGNCTSKNDCKIFCDDSKNVDACLAFAEQHNLMNSDELSNAKKFQDTGMTGPGGCQGKDKCDTYCNDPAHVDECITFAEKNGLMSDSELKEAKKVQVAIAKGIKPPACGGKKSCEVYCSSSEHMEECINFSIEAGIMDSQKQEESKKVLVAIKQGIKPPACKGKDECNQYCGTHQEECMTFSLAAGMVPDDQKEQMQKTLDAFKQGIKPPACQPNSPDQSGQSNQSNQAEQSKQGLPSCDQYCADSSHVEECVKFSVAIGNMTEEQGKNSIKNGNKGPGGCIGKDACDTFCNNPDNQDTCFNFAKDNGMIPEGDLQKMQDGQQKMKDSFSSIPQEVLDCITSSSGAGVVEQMKTGSVVGRKFGDSINQCFQKSGVEERPPGGDLPGQEQSNDQQNNQQGQKRQNQQGQQERNKFQPESGTKNSSEGRMPQQNQSNQLNQRLPQQQPGQPDQGVTNVGPCGTGPGTCSGIGPDDIKQPQQQQQQIQFNPGGQPEQPNQFNQLNQLNSINPNLTNENGGGGQMQPVQQFPPLIQQ